ncbi:MAG: DMT family transporter [Candidatus Thermoplasmatota archaeon]|jgi:drug/metabolite transporter (DMT)-like permease
MPDGSAVGRRAGRSGGIGSIDLALLLLLGGLWGTAFLFITVGLRSFSPILFVAIRFDIVGLVLVVLAFVHRAGSLVPRGRRQWTAIVVAAAFNVAGYHALLFWGQQFTTAGVAAIIVGLNPVLTTVFSRALLADERVGAGGVVGLALGMTGIVLLATLKGGNLLDLQGVAELAVVGAIASWSLGSVLVRRTGHGMDVVAFIAWHSLAGAGLLHVASLLFEGGGRATFDASGTVSMVYLSIVSSGLGFVIYFTLLSRIGPIRLNLVSQIAAAVAAVGGVLFLQEALEARALGAFALVAAGFTLVTRPKLRAAKPPLDPSEAGPR